MPKKIAKAALKGKKTADPKIKSAAELSKKAEELGLDRKPTTHKGKMHQEARAPKLVENPKKSILIKGMKTSITV